MDDNFDDIQEMETLENVDQEYEGQEPSNRPSTRQTISNVKNKVTSASGKGMQAAGKTTDAAGKGVKLAGKGTEATGKGMQVAGKGMQAAGQGTKAAGDAAMAAGEAISSSGVGAVAGVPLAALGAAGKVAGTGLDAAGKGTETAGKGVESAGKGMQTTGDKISDAGKKMDKTGKNIASKAKPATDATKGAVKAVKTTVDTVKKAVDVLKDPVKRTILIVVVSLLLIIIVIAAILEPLTAAMDKVKNGADQVEKLNNFIHGLGFQDCKDAFNDELEFLNKHYDGELDESLLMATLFYDDVFGTSDVGSTENKIEEGNSPSIVALMMALVDYTAKEALTEEDANGIVYSANKIFRLKRLTANMMKKDGGYLETVMLSDYLNKSGQKIGSDTRALMKSLVTVLCHQLLLSLDVFNVLADSFAGKILLNPIYATTLSNAIDNGYLTVHDGFDAITNNAANLLILLKDIISVISDIKGVGIQISIAGDPVATLEFGETTEDAIIEYQGEHSSEDFNSTDSSNFDFDIYVTYSKYELDEEGYIEYLKNDYIPKMPEFADLVLDKNGDPIDSKVEGVIEDIKMLADTWEEIYGDKDGSAMYNDVCIGNIHPDLINQFHLPIDLAEWSEVNFSTKTAFGVTFNGKKHNGVDLNEESVGVTAGSPVYSIYGGTVRASTASNDYNDDDKSGLGGWVRIEHSMSYINDAGENVNTTIYSVYGGLDPTTVPATGTTVSAGQQIGVIGNASQSEDGFTPGLHFAIVDIDSSTYLNPINVFITCSKYSEGGLCVYDKDGGLVIQFPDSIVSHPQWNYDVECYSADYGYGCYNNMKRWAYNQEIIWKMWVAAGAKYKNGIAVMKVNGLDRYMVATTAKMGQVGDMINATLENGEIIPMIIGDIKAYGDTGVSNTKICEQQLVNEPGCYGHQKSGNSIGVLEFQVDPVKFRESSNPAGWGQEWDTSQKVVSITRYSSILGSNSVSEICDNQFVDPSNPGVNPGGDDHTSISTVDTDGLRILNKPLDEFLLEKGSSIEEYNQAITTAKNMKGGNCKREAAVEVAVKTINYIAQYGVKLPYWLGGGHGDYPNNEDFKGVKASWGSMIHTTRSGDATPDGLDCSGFVRWILVTSGYNRTSFCVGNDDNCHGLTASQSSVGAYFPGATYAGSISSLSANGRLKPGDIIFSSGHIMYVVGVNSDSYRVAEAQQRTVGIVFSNVSFNSSGKYGIYMSNYYSNPSNCSN